MRNIEVRCGGILTREQTLEVKLELYENDIEALKRRVRELERSRLELAINHFNNAVAKADRNCSFNEDWMEYVRAYAKELERKSREWL